MAEALSAARPMIIAATMADITAAGLMAVTALAPTGAVGTAVGMEAATVAGEAAGIDQSCPVTSSDRRDHGACVSFLASHLAAALAESLGSVLNAMGVPTAPR